MNFFIKYFFSFLRIWSHLMKKSLMKKFIFCAVNPINPVVPLSDYAQKFFYHQNLLKSFPKAVRKEQNVN